MKLCTFEIKTALGRHQRLGAVLEEGILDLNSACAWDHARMCKCPAHRLADAKVPPTMLKFLQGEHYSITAAHRTVKSVQDKLRAGAVPQGPNEETLLFQPHDVTMKAPLPVPTSMRDFYAFEQHVKKGFEKRGEPMPQEWYDMPVYYKGAHWSIIGPDEDVHWPCFTEKFDYELELAIVIGKRGRNISEQDAAEYIAGYTIMNDFSASDIQKKEMKVRL